MRTGIENAIDAWNDALTGSGLPVFEATDVSCGGPYCINTQQDNISTGQECATQNINVNSATGEVSSTTITFPSASSGWNIPFNTRLAEHELGHLMGFKENTTSPSDYLPVVN